MTENEAIDLIRLSYGDCYQPKKVKEALEVAICALKEIQQCREAVKKPNFFAGFKDNSGSTNIEYMVAYWNKEKRLWVLIGKYDEIEEAKECYKKQRKCAPNVDIAIFKHIKSDTITQIYTPEE